MSRRTWLECRKERDTFSRPRDPPSVLFDRNAAERLRPLSPQEGPAPLDRIAMRVQGTLVHELAPLNDVGVQQPATALEGGDGEAEDPSFRRDKHTMVALILARQIGKKIGDSTKARVQSLFRDASPHELPRRVL